jgi:PAS domain S-box-containing protein
MRSFSWAGFMRYGVAVVVAAAAVWFRVQVDPLLGDQVPFAILFFAVLLMTWYGGFWPAVTTIIVGAIGGVYFLLPPRGHPVALRLEQQLVLGLYLGVSFGIALLGAAMRTGQRRAELQTQTVVQEREKLRVTLASIADAVIVADALGRVTLLNRVAQTLTGWAAEEARGLPLEQIFIIHNEQTGQPVENWVTDVLREGRLVASADHAVLTARDGFQRPIDESAAPIRDENGNVGGIVLVFRDVSEQRRAEQALRGSEARHRERARLAAFGKTVALCLNQADTLASMLDHCAQALVKHLDGAFARIWTLNDSTNVLELQASAGLYTHLDGPHSRVPVGKLKIGLIAQERKPHLTNSVVGDPRVGDQEWAKREGMVAFAGYPLLVEDRVVGVMAMFSRQPFSDVTLEALASVANGLASAIERRRAADQLREADGRKGRFLRILAQELRGPLFQMRSAIELVHRSTDDAAALGQAHFLLERELQDLTRLVNERLPDGEILPEPESN